MGLVPFQSALGWDHQSELSAHASQTDAKKGFGGRFGVQTDRQDKVGFDKHFTLYNSWCMDGCIGFIFSMLRVLSLAKVYF